MDPSKACGFVNHALMPVKLEAYAVTEKNLTQKDLPKVIFVNGNRGYKWIEIILGIHRNLYTGNDLVQCIYQ